jgi:hypothetical protein
MQQILKEWIAPNNAATAIHRVVRVVADEVVTVVIQSLAEGASVVSWQQDVVMPTELFTSYPHSVTAWLIGENGLFEGGQLVSAEQPDIELARSVALSKMRHRAESALYGGSTVTIGTGVKTLQTSKAHRELLASELVFSSAVENYSGVWEFDDGTTLLLNANRLKLMATAMQTHWNTAYRVMRDYRAFITDKSRTQADLEAMSLDDPTTIGSVAWPT